MACAVARFTANALLDQQLKAPAQILAGVLCDLNQWTLLVGALPLVYSLGAGSLIALPLDARQHEEFFLTAAQSLFAVALLLRLRFSLPSALILLILFLAQLAIGFVFQHDEARTVQFLTWFAWVYLLLAVTLVIANRSRFMAYVRIGLLNRSATDVATRSAR